MEGEGRYSAGNEGYSIPYGGVGEGGRFRDRLARYRLRAKQIPERAVPCLWIGQAEVEKPSDPMLDLLASMPSKEIDLIEQVQMDCLLLEILKHETTSNSQIELKNLDFAKKLALGNIVAGKM